MVLVSYSGKEINAKLVYYGPGLSGKTTNLEYIYGSIPGDHRGKMVSMKTKTERTLFFDFLPVQLGELSGFKTRFLLYTVPGQVYYNATRKLVLKGVDAVVFVADSKRGKMDENIESLQNLRDNLKEHGLNLDDVPWVIQYNKRDLPEVYSLDELEQVLNPKRVPAFEAVATNGSGVVDTFKAVSRLLLKKLSNEVGVPAGGRGAAAKKASADLDPTAQFPATSTPGTPNLGLVTGTPAPAESAASGAQAPSASAAPPEKPAADRATPAFDPNSPARPVASSGGFTNSSGQAITRDPSPASSEGHLPAGDSRPIPDPVDTHPNSQPASSDRGFVTAAESLRPPGATASPLESDPDVESSQSMGQRLRRWLKRKDDQPSNDAEPMVVSHEPQVPESKPEAEVTPQNRIPEPEPMPEPALETTPEPALETATEPAFALDAKPSSPSDPGVEQPEPHEVPQLTPKTAAEVEPQPDVLPAHMESQTYQEPQPEAPTQVEAPSHGDIHLEPQAETAVEASPERPIKSGFFRANPSAANLTTAQEDSSSEPPSEAGAPEAMGPREIVVPLELTPEDVECGITLRLDIRVAEDSSKREAA